MKLAQMTAVVVLTLAAGALYADGWGTLTAEFAYVGKAPKPAAIAAAAGAMCGAAVVDDGLTIGPKNELANVLVYLRQTKEGEVPIHADVVMAAKAPAILDNDKCYFTPKILPLSPGQPLHVGNKDAFGHNASFSMFQQPSKNFIVPAGGVVKEKFDKAEKNPAPVSCTIHTWMKGYVMLNANPYVAVSDAKGKIKLEKIPAGDWTFVIWHGGNVSTATQNGKDVKWENGRVKTAIKAGETTDWGKIEFAAKPL